MNDDVLTGPGLATLSVAAILAESAHRHPDKTAVIWAGNDGPEHEVSYRDLWDQARATAGVLRDMGIGKGDRVAMIIPNVPAFPRVYYAILALGAVAVPVHLLFKHDEIEHVLRDSGAKVAVVAAPMLGEALPAAAAVSIPVLSVMVPDEMVPQVPVPRLEDLAADATPIDRYVSTSPIDAATLLYTSGTTGTPKGAVGSHVALVEQVHVSLLDVFDLTHDDVIFGGLPLFHTFGQTAVLNTAFRRGCTIVMLPKFDAVQALEACVEYGVTAFDGVPTMFIALLQAAGVTDARPPLRFCVSGGASLPVAVLEQFQETFGAPVHEGYGLTETSPIVAVNPIGIPTQPGTVGIPLWGVDVVIADAEVEDRIVPLPLGELGEIVVRGHLLFKGYLGRAEATAEAVVDGFFRTGDLGTMSEDDHITIVDRKKDMIVRNGYNVYPSEVEAIMHHHEAVGNIAVFGVPHDTHGQEVHAAVVAAPGVTLDAEVADELIAYAKEHMAAYKFPRVVHVMDALPLGPSGKVLKRQLVAEFADAAPAAVAPPTSSIGVVGA
ncbi:long-chain-fatty-acid--CoA ligase [Curtobacterium sp. Leaf261]|uniref:long-chain-fatty-acid--CoA ligase n=1 Tax=Curtobacterium sp. Leaf261 TaxID=1736311 RepID=UPI0006FC3C1D|nr:long-chain fatty acid--CoA ligase [Curtobacterium sp. Leaf261]KQO65125.1 long-chain fatty acid--CoA ligase [Curtobacterium sp. Leaf261]